MLSRVVFRAVTTAITSSSFISSKTAVAVSRQFFRSLSKQVPPICVPTSTSINRFYSHTAAMSVDFDYVKKAVTDNSVLIIDVREPDELKEHGLIPNSINIPLGNVETTLSQMSDKQFKETYNRPKPAENTEIIFYCMVGRRSGMAQESAVKLGYKNVKNYLGSFNDWKEKNKV